MANSDALICGCADAADTARARTMAHPPGMHLVVALPVPFTARAAETARARGAEVVAVPQAWTGLAVPTARAGSSPAAASTRRGR